MAPVPLQRPFAGSFETYFVAAVLFLLIGLMVPCSSEQVAKRVSLQGKLNYKDAHVRDIWTLVQSGTGVVYKLPEQPLDSLGYPIPATSIVMLDCTPDPKMPTNCTKISRAEVSRAAASLARVGTQTTLRLLVMVVSYMASPSCGARSGASVANLRYAYTRDLGYMNFLRNCSYGQVTYSNVTVISTRVLCTAFLDQCDEESIAFTAKTSAANQYGPAFVSSYSRFAYVLPYGMLSACGWVGLAELSGTQTWYTPDGDGVFNKGTVLQESLHNFGIYHGWRNGSEYQDNSTAMGLGNSCPSAPELRRLGWASPLAQLDNSTLPIRTFKAFTLPATYVTSEGNMVRIQPDWLLPKAYKKNLYLALRMQGGGDRDLLDEFDGKVSVHEVNKSIDNFMAVGDPRVSLLRTIDPSTVLDMPTYKLRVISGALIGSTITVQICRYDKLPKECMEANLRRERKHRRVTL
ncbi:hypothetical protein VaNZ11_013970 [Volvox africanus]|uniref:Peptidase M11 gametolysin domain-containing protein n=1 Tax=Volvox africanus TaxID=51714 RepID=A0ABQ5SHE9_9CHLO|nr:hypothetical protein VaNZ11_013970 [Volvox africanus]